MKILMIAPEPFLESRGTPISIYQRLWALSSLAHTIDLLTYPVGQDVNIPGVTIHRIPNIFFIKEVKIGPSWPKLFLDILIFFKAITMLVVKRYDVIHTHEEAVFFSIILAAMFHTRHLYDMHSSLPQQLKNFNSWNYWLFIKLFELLERWAINICDTVITISSDLREHVRKINPVAKQIMIENLAIQITVSDTSQPSVERLKERLGLNGKLPIVYTGNFERYQGVELLIESVEIVKRQHPKVLFIFVGGKSQQIEYWQNEMRKKQLEDCTVFVGSVPLEEVSPYLEMAEILVSPRIEGASVPLKIYSYLLSGKPTVATNLLPHTQVLNEEIAMLVAPTKEAFAEGIARLIRDPDLRLQLGLKAQKFANEKYAPANYLAKLDQIYQALGPSRQLSKQPVSSVEGR
jgi:glycosyltransferase involved in cell wall biosynthesis